MMANNNRDEQDNPIDELPEDRLEELRAKDEPGKEEKKSRRKSSKVAKGEQPEGGKDPKKPDPGASKSSREDLLAEVRQSLLQDEDVDEEKKGVFGRIRGRFGKGSKSKSKEDTQVQPVSDVDIQSELDALISESKPKKIRQVSRKEEEAIQEFFADLDALATIEPDAPVYDALEVEGEEAQLEEVQPEVVVPPPRLPKKSEDEDQVDFEKIRDVALQEYDETTIETEYVSKKPIQEEVRETIREAKPLEKILIASAVILTVGTLLFSGVYLIANTISEAIPTPTPVATPDLSQLTYPTRVILPGGWEFDLGQGAVVDGAWTPNGAEWLIGTEISRWVALPWSVQLEAVLRTLQSDDQIELMMSNFDTLPYDVYSITEMSMEQILSLDTRKPSLVVVLFNGEGEEGVYWVVTALPAAIESQ